MKFIADLRLIRVAAAGLFLSSVAANAATVTVNDRRCVNVSVTRAHASITDYAAYPRLPGATYSAIGIDMLSMYKSQPTYFARTDTATHALVHVALRPLTVRDTGRHPQFVLNCRTEFTSATSFKQICNQQLELTSRGRTFPAPRYAVDRFDSTLEVTEGGCSNGDTLLKFELTIDMNSAEVQEIKEAVGDLFIEPLRSAILAFFNEEAFFHTYYTNFYDGWVRSIRR